MLSALALATWAELGNTGPDLEAGADYHRADLARIKPVQASATSDIKRTDGELLPGEASTNTNCTPLLCEQPCRKAPQPKKQLPKPGLGWAPLRTMFCITWDWGKSILHTGRPAVGKCEEFIQQGRGAHWHPNKSHDTLLFPAPSQHADIANQVLQNCLQDISGRMQSVLSRMLLSIGGPSDPILLRYFHVTFRDCQGLESRKINEFGSMDTEKRGNSLTLLAMLIIPLFVL